jgi:hypothetical protein
VGARASAYDGEYYIPTLERASERAREREREIKRRWRQEKRKR